MREILLIKNGELALKGLNRGTFESALMKNLRHALTGAGNFTLRKAQSTIFVEPDENADLDEAAERVSKVFGIAAFSRAAVCEKSLPAIEHTAVEVMSRALAAHRGPLTFKVEAKRADKTFSIPSPALCEEVGGALCDAFPSLKVDVHTPALTVFVEVRDFGAYVHFPQRQGAGGMPVGTAGRAALLLSGGIDSPVAAYMMAKRGLRLVAVHFASPPYTSPMAEQKVRDLLSVLSPYTGRVCLYIVPFTRIQEAIRDRCPEELFTVLMRRMMMRVGSEIARGESCGALITGESLGQVASQTVPAISCTDAVASLPVFRPLIGMDKEEIVRLSRQIGTFSVSTLPYEDCCTVFTPRHPRLRPVLSEALHAEEKLDVEKMVADAIAGIERVQIDPHW